MSRLVVPGLDLSAERVELPREATHHAARVLRLGPGDPVTLLDGSGTEAVGVIEGVSAGGMKVRVESRSTGSSEPASAPLHLVLGLPKGDKADEIVRRATELGVAAIHLALAHRSVSRPDPARAAKRLERWRRIAIEASRQCGRPRVPELAEVVPFEEALEAAGGQGPRAVLWEEERETGLAALLGDARPTEAVALAIGPEGGLTVEEVDAARGLGYVPASLGPLVLRVETAAVAAIAVAAHLLGGLRPPGQ